MYSHTHTHTHRHLASEECIGHKPGEVVATEKSTVATEAFVAQEAATVGALYACAVPRLAENI